MALIVSAKLIGQDVDNSTLDVRHHLPIEYSKIIIPDKFKDEGIVIISDKTVFNLTGYDVKTLHRTVLLKIVNNDGLRSLQGITLPECFDIAENKELWQQGRLSKIKIPNLKYFEINYFEARIIKPDNTEIKLDIEKTYKTVRWINPSGAFGNDDVPTYSFKGLTEGDLLEYSYTLAYKANYGGNMFYMSSEWPKMDLDYRFTYNVLPEHRNAKFILTNNVPDSCITIEKDTKSQYSFVTEIIRLKNVQKVNYFIHACASKQLPFAYFNMNYTIRLFNNKSLSIANLPDFNWTGLMPYDETEFKWHVKFPEDIKKFAGKFQKFEKDSNNLGFMKALTDTLNSFKYYSLNYMFYNDPRLYNVYSTDHLFKRRISEMNLLRIYENLLNCKKIFYYITNLQDKRLGENNPLIRNRAYENIILAIPGKGTFTYFIPRYNGLTYFLNELPFYYEGALAAMFPINYIKLPGDTMGNRFMFVKTHGSTAGENVRIENCSVKINTDSACADLFLRETLSGQFSTILRHFYLNETIDSTVNRIYFKKCFNKPNLFQLKTEFKRPSNTYPFKFGFDCSGKIALGNQEEINLAGWFSFVLDNNLIPEKPSHDFYFDFAFSDIYNFVFKFPYPVNITNAVDFEKDFDNDYFELHSSLSSEEKDYLVFP